MLVVKVLYLWVKTFKLAFEIKKGASYGKKDLCGIIKMETGGGRKDRFADRRGASGREKLYC